MLLIECNLVSMASVISLRSSLNETHTHDSPFDKKPNLSRLMQPSSSALEIRKFSPFLPNAFSWKWVSKLCVRQYNSVHLTEFHILCVYVVVGFRAYDRFLSIQSIFRHIQCERVIQATTKSNYICLDIRSLTQCEYFRIFGIEMIIFGICVTLSVCVRVCVNNCAYSTLIKVNLKAITNKKKATNIAFSFADTNMKTNFAHISIQLFSLSLSMMTKCKSEINFNGLDNEFSFEMKPTTDYHLIHFNIPQPKNW